MRNRLLVLVPGERINRDFEGLLEQGENALRGSSSRHPAVEARAEHTQRLVKLGGEQKDEKGLGKRKPTVQQAQADLNGDDRGAQGGD